MITVWKSLDTASRALSLQSSFCNLRMITLLGRVFAHDPSADLVCKLNARTEWKRSEDGNFIMSEPKQGGSHEKDG